MLTQKGLEVMSLNDKRQQRFRVEDLKRDWSLDSGQGVAVAVGVDSDTMLLFDQEFFPSR